MLDKTLDGMVMSALDRWLQEGVTDMRSSG